MEESVWGTGVSPRCAVPAVDLAGKATSNTKVKNWEMCWRCDLWRAGFKF